MVLDNFKNFELPDNNSLNYSEINLQLKKKKDTFNGVVLGLMFNFMMSNVQFANDGTMFITDCTVIENKSRKKILLKGVVAITNAYTSYIEKYLNGEANHTEIRHTLWYGITPTKNKSQIKYSDSIDVKKLKEILA